MAVAQVGQQGHGPSQIGEPQAGERAVGIDGLAGVEEGPPFPILRPLQVDYVMSLPRRAAVVYPQAAGVIPARIAKSLSFKVEDRAVLIIAAGDAKVDNPKFKAAFHTKAKMLTHEEAHELIGHDVGGVCPFALPEAVQVYLDVSMQRFETVFPAAGSSNSAVEMTCDELERYASNFAAWVDVCKGWRPEEQG